MSSPKPKGKGRMRIRRTRGRTPDGRLRKLRPRTVRTT